MFFDEGFIDELRFNPIHGVLDICKRTLGEINQSGSSDYDYELLLESYTLIDSLVNAQLIEKIELPSIHGDKDSDSYTLIHFLEKLLSYYEKEVTKLKLESYKNKFQLSLNAGFSYELSQGDLERIQQLINELRSEISNSDFFEQDHKQRLLKRLEKIQSELHKRMSDLDKFWGLIGDAGVAIGKFGEDVKPIVERVKEITEIIWRTQARAEELPSDAPLPKLESTSSTDVS